MITEIPFFHELNFAIRETEIIRVIRKLKSGKASWEDMILNPSCLMYADDTVILSEIQSGLQRASDRLQEYYSKWHIAVKEGKTKVTIFNKSARTLVGDFFLSSAYLFVSFCVCTCFAISVKIFRWCNKYIFFSNLCYSIIRGQSCPARTNTGGWSVMKVFSDRGAGKKRSRSE